MSWYVPVLAFVLCFGALRCTAAATSANTLVMYLYTDRNADFRSNLRFFIDRAIVTDPQTFIVVITSDKLRQVRQAGKLNMRWSMNSSNNEVKCLLRMQVLPYLPVNGLHLDGAPCHSFGAYKWALQKLNILLYDYIVLMTSTARGPFMPVYSKNTRWLDPFITRINKQVKLVGPTISCVPTGVGLNYHHTPYVQVGVSPV